MRVIVFTLLVFCVSNISLAQYIIPEIEAGCYDHPFILNLNITDDDLDIYYTTDGTEPSRNSSLYSKNTGIYIDDRSELENNYSNIPSVKMNWKDPEGLVAKGTIVWAQAFNNETAVGEPSVSSYFIGLNYSFPIFSIVTKPEHFFSDSSGILVPGDRYDPTNNMNGNANQRGRDWERPAQIEFFTNKKLKLKQHIGVRIHGLSSRSLPQKSLRLYARNDYGKKYFEFPFFNDLNNNKFKRLILRSPGSDWSDTFFKDELIHQMVRDEFDLETQDFLPTIVFINGEYWGIYNLRERQDKHYLSLKYELDEDALNILENDGNIVEGENISYLNLLDFAKNNDLSILENYKYVYEKVDIQNFIDYHITQLFFANQDWPRNNYKFWKANEGNQYKKWRWLFFDCDFCMIFHHDEHFGVFLDNKYFGAFNKSGEDFPEWSTLLLKSLLVNNEFRRKFTNSFFNTVSKVYSTDLLLGKINSFEKLYAPEVNEHIRRWNNPGNVDIWNENVNDLRKFAIQRKPFVIQKFEEYIGSVFTVSPNPTSSYFRMQCALDTDEKIHVKMLSALGQEVLSQEFPSSNALNNHLFQATNFVAGHYYLIFYFRGIHFTQKMVIL